MTDHTDFERALERRISAYAATVARPVAASEIARTTIAAAATMPVRPSRLRGPSRPTLLLGLAAILLLGAAAGLTALGERPPAIQGVFVSGPSLDAGRIASALTLPDGRVLVGMQPVETTVPGATTLRCEPLPCEPWLTVLDPATGAFTPTRDQAPSSFAVESMALLQDGRVLLVSDWGESDDPPTAVRYDPVVDRFEEVGAQREARDWPFLVTLHDGRVLIGGGQTQGVTRTSELFDPATGSFTAAGSMARPRTIGTTATLLRDGRVLVVGGGPDLGSSAELFDPTTGTFARTGETTVARGAFHTATLLPDGRVLIAGGLVHDEAIRPTVPSLTATAEVYDPATGTFSAVGSLAAPRFGHAAALLADGTVLIAGGAHELPAQGAPEMAADAEIFDPASGAFRATGDLVRPRLLPATAVVDGRVLVLGHLDPTGEDPDAATSTEWFE